MRLIDADALKEEITAGKEHVAKHQDPTISLLTYVIDGFSALVDRNPTIDAIPVEWLKQQFYDNPKSQWAEKCRDVYTKWQKWQRWRKEQEGR